MTRRRFAMPCSFSSRKTARRYGFQGLLNLHSLALRFQGFAAPDNPKIDYLTFVPDGEPTLDVFLGKAIGLLQRLKIKIAVISNASLIWRKQVRDMLKQADWVSLKMDSVDEAIWRRINRPDQRLNLDDILSGMLDFKQEFQGTLVTETMLLQDINTGPAAAVESLGLFLQKLAPDKSYLAIPTRPTADNSAIAVDAGRSTGFTKL